MSTFRKIMLLAVFSVLFLSFEVQSNRTETSFTELPAAIAEEYRWVDSVFNSLSLDQRIGQLFMIAAYSNKDVAHENEVERLIKSNGIGGLIFFQGEPIKQANLTNRFQRASKVPMLISIDGEWGLSMRLKNTTKFPRQLLLGAMSDENLIYEMGREIGRQCRRMGIHINLAPVIDVNNNPNNPVINDRSFGEDKMNVARKSIQYMRGLQDEKIMACGKHFPGHGDTNADSHYDLPVINHDINRLQDIELYPFRELFNNGLQSVMIAHLSIPSLDATPNLPSTLSRPIVTGLLKEQMGYKGLVFTDALNMKGVTKHFPSGEIEVRALEAGNDVLLFPEQVDLAINQIKNAIRSGRLNESDINNKVTKILSAKYKAGLNRYRPIAMTNLLSDLNIPQADLLKRQMIENAVTVVRNDKNLIPINNLETKNIATLTIGGGARNSLTTTMDLYAQATHYYIGKIESAAAYDAMYNKLQNHNLIVVSFHDMSKFGSKGFGISQQSINMVKKLNQTKDVILIINGSPYSLKYWSDIGNLICTYEDNRIVQNVTTQILFGSIGAKGKLPVTASPQYSYGAGLTTYTTGRLKYSLPESVGMSSYALLKIDSIANKAIADKATPGCQVLVAKDNHIVYYRAFGHHTYDKARPVNVFDIYDLASLTKILGTNISLMHLYDKGAISLDGDIGSYLPRLSGQALGKRKLKDILVHEAGYRSWIPFYEHSLNSKGKPGTAYNRFPDATFSVEVAKDLYMKRTYQNTVWDTILASKLKPVGNYRYSDLGFIMFKEMIEAKTRIPMDQFTYNQFYRPMGLATLGYNPLKRFSPDNIVPTEKDDYFRHQLLQGHVHDMAAAMFGGVSGHAGLFGNANDVAVLMQMLLNGGQYAGKQYLENSTVNLFTAKNRDGNRRGLGFDKPDTRKGKISPCSDNTPSVTFGHSGFTGTCAWADPSNNLVYVFLSNRVHPEMSNNKLVKENIRTEIQSAIYDAIASSQTVVWD